MRTRLMTHGRDGCLHVGIILTACEDDLRVRQIALTDFNAEPLDEIGGVTKSRRVDEAKGYRLSIEQCLDCVAGGAGNRRHECAGFAKQCVEQRRLPGIWRPGNDHQCAITE